MGRKIATIRKYTDTQKEVEKWAKDFEASKDKMIEILKDSRSKAQKDYYQYMQSVKSEVVSDSHKPEYKVANEFRDGGKIGQELKRVLKKYEGIVDDDDFVRLIKEGEISLTDVWKDIQNAINKNLKKNVSKVEILKDMKIRLKHMKISNKKVLKLRAKYTEGSPEEIWGNFMNNASDEEWTELYTISENALNQQKSLSDASFQEFAAFAMNKELAKFHLDNIPAYIQGDINITANQIQNKLRKRLGGKNYKLAESQAWTKYGDRQIPIQLKVGKKSSFKLDYKIGGVYEKQIDEAIKNKVYGIENVEARIAYAMASYDNFKSKADAQGVPMRDKEKGTDPKEFLEAYMNMSASEYYVFGFDRVEYNHGADSKRKGNVLASGYWSISVPKDCLLDFFEADRDAWKMDEASKGEGDKLKYESNISTVAQLFDLAYGTDHFFPVHYNSDYTFYAARQQLSTAKNESNPKGYISDYNKKILSERREDFMIVHEAVFGGLLKPVLYYQNFQI